MKHIPTNHPPELRRGYIAYCGFTWHWITPGPDDMFIPVYWNGRAFSFRGKVDCPDCIHTEKPE